MLFDTHAHYDDERFDGDRDELLGSMKAAGVGLIVNAASGMESSRCALSIAERHDFVYASVGVHPHDVKEMDDSSVAELSVLSANPKCVAIGEIGLDYHYDLSPRDTQKARFAEQLELARRVKKPVIIHEREAIADTLDILKNYRDLLCVVHCFSGSVETAKTLLDWGFFLSFTGVVTFKNAKKAAEVVKYMPQERLMIETDSPYLSPEPVRGGRNSSLNLIHIAQKVADIRAVPLEEIATVTTENGRHFFNIGENT